MKTCSRCKQSKIDDEFSPKQSHCKKCCAEKRAIWRSENKEKMDAENAAFRAKNPTYSRDHYLKNKESESLRKAIYYRENTQKVRERLNRYHASKPHVRNAITAKRRSLLLNAIPPWADLKAIRSIYAEAKSMVEPHEVDHIYPLQGKLICGLHCESNLQVIPLSQNRRKGARMPE